MLIKYLFWSQAVLPFDSQTLRKVDGLIDTGKSLSEALIFASTNPQYDDRLFIVHENSDS